MTVTNIATADIVDLAVTDAKIASVGGSKIIDLDEVPSGSGVLPIANLPTIPIASGGTGAITAQLGLNALAGAVTANRVLRADGSNIGLAQVVLTTDVTGTLPVGNGGTGVTAAANAANGVVVLNASSQLPAVSGALLTNLPAQAPTQVNDTDAGTQLTTSNPTFLTVNKTITSGNTVLLIASGYLDTGSGLGLIATLTLNYTGGTAQTIKVSLDNGVAVSPSWSMLGIVTGLSGAKTFSVAGDMASGTCQAYGNLEVIEF